MRRLANAVWQAIVCLLLLVPPRPEIVTEKPSEAPIQRCWEDEPCWDCHTMGNQICGTE